MSTLSLKLADSDAAKLAELAAREGATPEEVAAEAVRARLAADAAARREIEAGLAELDEGEGMTLDTYEREMDAFMAELKRGRG